MKKIRLLILLNVVLYCGCAGDRDDKREILSAKFLNHGVTTTKCLFTAYSDSTYVFRVHEFRAYRYEKNETFRGRYFLKGDSIVFFPFDFDYVSAGTAVIKNNYLEFVDGRMPFKMKMIQTLGGAYTGLDTVKFQTYGLFTHHPSFYRRFTRTVTPYDLTNGDLDKIEGMLQLCIKENNLSFDLRDYFKQCLAVRNENNEREVWINLLCNPRNVEELHYNVISSNDGGDCYWNVMINLDKGQYYNLRINGHA